MTLDRIIKEYIASDDARRIIIPGIGAFIKRGGGELVFMDLLNADDGILTTEVSRRKEIPSDKAAARLAKYTAALRSELDKGRPINIEGLGTITPSGGRLTFTAESDDLEPIVKEARNEFEPKPSEDTKPGKPVAKEAVGNLTEEPLSEHNTCAEQQPEADAYVPRIHIRQQTKKRKRTDVVMIIAILALLAAIAVIVYGVLVEKQITVS